MAAFDFHTGALFFIVSLAAAPCTRRYRFMASFRCMSIFKTCFAAHWSFKIFESFRLCSCSLGISMNLGGTFSLEVSRIGGEEVFLVVIYKLLFSHLEVCTLSLVDCRILRYPGCYSRGCSSGLGFG